MCGYMIDYLMQKELCSIDIGDLRESAVVDYLDKKYLADYEI